MSASQLAAQLYTVRDFTGTPADIAQTMKKVKQIGYDAVQCSALGVVEPRELKRLRDRFDWIYRKATKQNDG